MGPRQRHLGSRQLRQLARRNAPQSQSRGLSLESTCLSCSTFNIEHSFKVYVRTLGASLADDVRKIDLGPVGRASARAGVALLNTSAALRRSTRAPVASTDPSRRTSRRCPSAPRVWRAATPFPWRRPTLRCYGPATASGGSIGRLAGTVKMCVVTLRFYGRASSRRLRAAEMRKAHPDSHRGGPGRLPRASEVERWKR